jgi:negative regulator of sigma E activity
MNEHEHREVLEASWRRSLTPEEEAALQLHLATHPDEQLEWDDEVALTAALRNLPNAPLSSNFTSQVLQAIDREEAAQQRTRSSVSGWGWLRRWVPRFASVAVALTILLTVLNFYQARSRRDATSVFAAAAPIVNALPAPEVLEDFDVIQQLRAAPEFNDQELVAVLLN